MIKNISIQFNSLYLSMNDITSNIKHPVHVIHTSNIKHPVHVHISNFLAEH